MHPAAARVRGHRHPPHRVPADARRRPARRARVTDPAPGQVRHAETSRPSGCLRIGLVLGEGQGATQAKLAEAHGLFRAIAGWANPLTAVNAAIYASTATRFAPVVTRSPLGLRHPPP